MELYLVRHGQTQANLDGVYCGRSNLPLTAQGSCRHRRSRASYRGGVRRRLCQSPVAYPTNLAADHR
ncbi:histidine phosphatase family protein [Edwardsiella tarda]